MAERTAPERVLIAIPAYNEEATIGDVVRRVRAYAPQFDLLVVDDGSQDGTGRILNALGVTTATHLCNMGYGRSIQTAIKYALLGDYSALITLDADGQHCPEQLQALLGEFDRGGWDMLIGSRRVGRRVLSDTPLGRRVGISLFSTLVRLITGKRIFDTTSGLKVIRRVIFEPLTYWHFVDFHAEAIVYLLQQNYSVGEYPVVVEKRASGQSMYSAISHLKYPLKTTLMVLLGMVEAGLTRRKKKQ
jgi:glycosyltransferase involved in cell wall biosynthesis